MHTSIMRPEVVALFSSLRTGGVYVDATLGAGGHSEAILQMPDTVVVGIDRDPRALELARVRLAQFGDRFFGVHGRFSDLKEHLARLELERVDGILADVGLSSMQIDDPARGMSFRFEGPLDMRMDPTVGETALDLIDNHTAEDLADLIYHYGEERHSRRIARSIKFARERNELATTTDLRRAIVRAVGPGRHGGIDPATRTFQALRIAVNGELRELASLLEMAPTFLVSSGVLAIISFHSLEDRMVKQAFKERSIWRALTKKPLTASDAEVEGNPRARSAKLRAAVRVEEEQLRGIT
ncbi:16S rRNA methyltransferase [Chondromyces crocatus]|uniref:Ribosomal RNA small subunit methyltransferase H n=1 Tax=Chondromyces crocatus TaxID=52 RepID=A0A0K1EN38_CHOCO|nr:16S rRNA methyltransferase [Chondromyces crocatus]